MVFFIHFFDLVGADLLATLGESIKNGFIPDILNATYITLIPKRDKPGSFNDDFSISLCNLVYKVIANIIASRINPFLEQKISKEQFGLLSNR